MTPKQIKVGLIDVDGHNFPNFALMRIAAWHKAQGDSVEWANPLLGGGYDRVYQSKIFTFTSDAPNYFWGRDCEIIKGGTGYDIGSTLAPEIEQSTKMDYSIYPQHDYSVQFFSRGCIRRCPFCLVREKEGLIHPVEPVDLNPNGRHIEVLDNNFFANPEWKSAVEYLRRVNQPVNLRGVDVRIMDEEQAFYLNQMRLYKSICIAWDLPQLDLTDKLKEVTKYLKPYKLACYVLVGYDSTVEQDMFRIETLRSFGIKPFVMPYRDYENKQQPSQYARDLAQYVNKPMVFKSCSFAEFSPRKGFKCSTYLSNNAIQQ